MNFQKKIEQNIGLNKRKNPHDVFNNINFICAHEFKWSYKDIVDSPIPFVLSMLNKWQEMKKEEKKAMKKRR